MSFWKVNGVDFDALGLHVSRDFSGIGMPPVQHNFQSYALQPGALYQNTKILPRILNLTVDLEGSSYANMHTLHQALCAIFQPITPSLTPEVEFEYTGGATAIHANFRYISGLEWLGYVGFGQTVPLQLIATDPFWYEDGTESHVLGGSEIVLNANYGLARHNGTWYSLGTGFDAPVRALAVDAVRGRVYYGGAFTTGNGITLDNIGWLDPDTLTFSPLAGGGLSSDVYCLAVASNGDVWAGHAGGLSRYNFATDDWTHFTDDPVLCVAIAPNGTVYIAGGFTSWQTVTGADYIASYSGGAWHALGTSPFTSGHFPTGNQAMAFSSSGVLYVGEYIVTGTSVALLRTWNGTTWGSSIGTAGAGANEMISALLFVGSTLYIGGDLGGTLGGVSCANIGSYNGTIVSAMGAGLAGICASLTWENGLLYAGEAAPGALVKWSGTAWYPIEIEIDLGGDPNALVVASLNGDLFTGFFAAGTATITGSGAVTPTSDGPVFPTITLTLAASTALLSSITNETTGHVLNFTLTIHAGETIVIDLSPGKKTITSTLYGSVLNTLTPGSDLGNFCLLGGVENSIAIVSDNPALVATLSAPIAHLSAIGA